MQQSVGFLHVRTLEYGSNADIRFVELIDSGCLFDGFRTPVLECLGFRCLFVLFFDTLQTIELRLDGGILNLLKEQGYFAKLLTCRKEIDTT